jgi:hypothetical protein
LGVAEGLLIGLMVCWSMVLGCLGDLAVHFFRSFDDCAFWKISSRKWSTHNR